jgi:hypothetical protein
VKVSLQEVCMLLPQPHSDLSVSFTVLAKYMHVTPADMPAQQQQASSVQSTVYARAVKYRSGLKTYSRDGHLDCVTYPHAMPGVPQHVTCALCWVPQPCCICRVKLGPLM